MPDKKYLNTQTVYIRSISGLISKIYGGQKGNSKKRNHLMPNYTKKQLEVWLYKNNFLILYKNWVESKYKKDLIPSVDRKNDYLPYTLENIQLMTWEENNSKAKLERKQGINNKCSIEVAKFDKKGTYIKTYKSIALATKDVGLKSYTNIADCCKGKRKSAGGFIWQYKK